MAADTNSLTSSLTKRMRFAGETSLFEIAGKPCTVVQAFHPSHILKSRNVSSEGVSSDRRRFVRKTALLDFCFLRAVNAVQDTLIVGDGLDKLRGLALGLE